MSKRERLYPWLPIWLQNLVVTAYGYQEARYRFSSSFRERLCWLGETETWTPGRIEEYKDHQVRLLIRHAYETVPYYQRVMDGLGLTPDDIRGTQDLVLLPVLTKGDVRRAGAAMISNAYDRSRLRTRRTSGTTGSALTVWKTREADAFQWAVWWRHRQRFGIDPGVMHVNFSIRPVVPATQRKPPYWRYNRAFRQHLVGMHHIRPGRVADIVRFLGRLRARVFVGYPSVISELARLAMDAGAHLDDGARPSHVFLGAEKPYSWQTDLIEQWTGAVVNDQYGAAEGCGNASRCPSGLYHEDFEFGHFEFLDERQEPQGERSARLVCTGFSNLAMPLIRYEIGDTVILPAVDRGCECGRHSRIVREIGGRLEDYVVTPDGGRVMRVDPVFKDTAFIREAQVVQKEVERITILAVTDTPLTEGQIAMIRSKVATWISPRLGVDVVRVDRLVRESNGKLRAVKSELVFGQVDGIPSQGRDEHDLPR